MPQVPVNDIPPGSRLGEPLLDSRGRILLAEGTPLTATLIQRLRRWRVAYVKIVAPKPEELLAPLDRLERRWDVLFAGSGGNPEMRIIEHSLRRWAKKQRQSLSDTKP